MRTWLKVDEKQRKMIGHDLDNKKNENNGGKKCILRGRQNNYHKLYLMAMNKVIQRVRTNRTNRDTYQLE
jgi:hypothetical protein